MKKDRRMRQILEFFEDQKKRGITKTQQKDLKIWARNAHMSPTTLHQNLKKLVSMGYIVKEESPDGVFYALNQKLRDWHLENIRNLEKKSREIVNLPEKEKVKALEELINLTMGYFFDFVPFVIHFALINEDLEKSKLQSVLEDFWHWLLNPFVLITVHTCRQNREAVSQIRMLKMMDKNYQEYFKSEFFKNFCDAENSIK